MTRLHRMTSLSPCSKQAAANRTMAAIIAATILLATGASAQLGVSGTLSPSQDYTSGVSSGTYSCPQITVNEKGRVTAISNGSCSGGSSPTLKFKIGWLLSGSGNWTPDPYCVAGYAMLRAPGGAGASVQSGGTVLYGANGGNVSFNSCTVNGGHGGGVIGDQGAGGVVGTGCDAWINGANGDGYGDAAGGKGGGAGGAHATWQANAEQGPNQSGGGGSGGPGPANGSGGYRQAGTGGGEGALAYKAFTCGAPIAYSLGTPGMPQNPGAGGYWASQGANGAIMLFQLVTQ